MATADWIKEAEEQAKKYSDSIKSSNQYLIDQLNQAKANSLAQLEQEIADLEANDGTIDYNTNLYYGSSYYEVYPKREKEIKNYNIYGSLCTINDIIVKNINSFELQIGDVFIFKNVGAYSSTEGISLFLSRDLPCIVLYKDNKFIKVRDNLKSSDINYPNY